jgi:nucleotide-binding universal stress UspA family protein
MVIVAAVDQSERASAVVTEAIELGRAYEETVHVVHVTTESAFDETERGGGDSKDEAVIRESAREVAAAAADGVKDSVKTVGLIGEPSNTIVGYAEEQDARYIVLGPRKRSPVGKAVFGSVAQSVLLNATHPVVTVVSD